MLSFGKYKGKSINWVSENDENYCVWAIKHLKNSKSEKVKNEIKLLSEKFEVINIENKILKKAWYTQPNAKILIENEISPEIGLINENIIDTIREINLIDYCKYLGFNVESEKEAKLIIRKNNLILPSFSRSQELGLIKRDIAKAIIELKPIYYENIKWDKEQTLPTKKILNYWIVPKNIIGKDIGEGKWCLYFNKINEIDGITELDKNYLLVKNNWNKITKKFGFKCSTSRPNPNASNNYSGVIILYCDINSRDKIIEKISKILGLKKRVYWKYHCAGYAKDGIKVSSHFYDPK